MLLPLDAPPAQPFRVNAPTDPPGNVGLMLDRTLRAEGGEYRWRLVHHRQKFLLNVGTHYTVLPADELEQRVSWYFENAEYLKVSTARTNPPPPVWTKFPVTSSMLTDLMRALRNKVIIPESINFNTWLEERPGDPDPMNLIPLRNGLLNWTTRQLMPHNPRFFNTYCLPFDYDPHAPDPTAYFTYMRSMFGTDEDRWRLAQEMKGYLLTPRRDLHKMFCLTGPPRSGKGTMARLIEQLVGEENFGATSLSELSGAHGLEEIATKPVVLMGDAAFTGESRGAGAMERLLGIVGEDAVPVNPKGKKVYTAKLPCRFLLLANDLPALPDKAQALRQRWTHLRFTKSFAGAEDRELDAKLERELPGIFNWALDGLDRLQSRGDFVQPETGKEDLDILTQLVSPHTAFVADCCEIGSVDDPDCREANADLYQVWTNYCFDNGIKAVGSLVGFGKALRAVPVCGHLKGEAKTLATVDRTGKQRNATLGIRLTAEAKAQYLMDPDSFKLSKMTGVTSAWVSNL